FQIVDRAPSSGSGQRCGFFPGVRARCIICFFFATPKNVAHVQRPGEIGPIRSPLNQFGELLVRFTVIIESLRPKMSRISHHDFSAIEEQWMIVGRPGRHTRYERPIASSEVSWVPFTAIA